MIEGGVVSSSWSSRQGSSATSESARTKTTRRRRRRHRQSNITCEHYLRLNNAHERADSTRGLLSSVLLVGESFEEVEPERELGEETGKQHSLAVQAEAGEQPEDEDELKDRALISSSARRNHLCPNQNHLQPNEHHPNSDHRQHPNHRQTAAAAIVAASHNRQRGLKLGQAARVKCKSLRRFIRWPLVHLCLPLCLASGRLAVATSTMLLLLLLTVVITTTSGLPPERQVESWPFEISPAAAQSGAVAALHRNERGAPGPPGPSLVGPNRKLTTIARLDGGLARLESILTADDDDDGPHANEPQGASRERRASTVGRKGRRHARSLLMPINELRVSGSKLEPPSRPSQDWSKQRPYFGSNIQRNISVELGKTAHLTCKVFELGDKTVSWLRPRENEILTAGKYTYIGDSRISSMNENGSTDWILEIKDVNVNDSTSYECQVSTDPKMSMIINLHVQAARARIKSGENNYYPVGANIEFTCEVLPPNGQHLSRAGYSLGGPQADDAQQGAQVYWYHNGNLINYAKTNSEYNLRHNDISIDWDRASQTSKLKLANIQLADSGNYTCKPSSAEPATVRLFVKKPRGNAANRVHYSGGAFHGKEAAQRTRPHYGLDATSHNGLDLVEASNSASRQIALAPMQILPLICLLLILTKLS